MDKNDPKNQAAANSSLIRERQSGHGIVPSQAPRDDIAVQVRASVGQASADVAVRRRSMSQEQGGLSEDYNASVNRDRVSQHHGGNRAIWDTVGAQTDNRAKLGEAQAKPTVGEWHLDKDGTPVRGPAPGSKQSGNAPSKPKGSLDSPK